jgi:hypothetical protein
VKRITVDEALKHPFLQSLHNPDDEPVANFTFTFDFEHEELGRERIQELIWEEMRTYHPEISHTYPSSTRRKSKHLKELDIIAEAKGGEMNVSPGEKGASKGNLKRSISDEK